MVHKQVARFKVVCTICSAHNWLILQDLCKLGDFGGSLFALTACVIREKEQDWLNQLHSLVEHELLHVVVLPDLYDIADFPWLLLAQWLVGWTTSRHIWRLHLASLPLRRPLPVHFATSPLRRWSLTFLWGRPFLLGLAMHILLGRKQDQGDYEK